jgi:predicted DNA-binding ribbon-helix-helix protein
MTPGMTARARKRRRITEIAPTDLRQIARGRQVTVSDLIASLDAARGNSNLSSAIRVFILHHYCAMAGQSDVGITPLGAIPRAAVIVNPTAMALTNRPPGGASPRGFGVGS